MIRNFIQLFSLGALITLGFAPFYKFQLLLLAILCFYLILNKRKQAFQAGFFLGIGINTIGTSWIFNSIYEYGHISYILSGLLTVLFVLYVATFYGFISLLYGQLCKKIHFSLQPLLFAACWCSGEWLKSHLFGGFPWLNLGFATLNTPFASTLPILGVYAPGFLICLSMGYLGLALQKTGLQRLYGLIGILLCLIPNAHEHINPTQPTLNVSIIQGNVKSPDKWDEQFFWQQFADYIAAIQKHLANKQLIILPEAALSVPRSYLAQQLTQLEKISKTANSAVLIGIPELSTKFDYYNTLMALGSATGSYKKQQLVPFGESIPHLLLPVLKLLNINLVNTVPGGKMQPLITVFNQKIASLICYELAYPELLRAQASQAKFIVSISDDGWFGHSLALHQHLQMAQVLSFMTQKYQVFVNNNGLSSLINNQGEIIAQLPAWQKSQLNGQVKLNDFITPWVIYGDTPVFISLILLALFTFKHNYLRVMKLTLLRRFITSN